MIFFSRFLESIHRCIGSEFIQEFILKRSILSAVALLASAITLPTFAQSGIDLNGRPYVGVAAGQSHVNASCDTGISCDNTDTAIKLYGGYEFNNKFAAELTYFDLGKFKANNGTDTSEAKGSYWGLGGAWRPEFGGGWGGVARLGAAYTTGKVDYSIGGIGGSESRNDWHPYYGLGVNYEVAKNIKLEAAWDNTRVSTQALGTRSTDTVNSYTLGASFGF